MTGECPWCVRVTCRCEWSGTRPHRKAEWRCPRCHQFGHFKVKGVSHRIGTLCTFRRFRPEPRRDGPQ